MHLPTRFVILFLSYANPNYPINRCHYSWLSERHRNGMWKYYRMLACYPNFSFCLNNIEIFRDFMGCDFCGRLKQFGPNLVRKPRYLGLVV